MKHAGLATCANSSTSSSARCWWRADAEIEVTDLPDTLDEIPSSPGEFQVPPGWTLADVERMAILRTLERTRWNKQEAAAVLGLYRPTLYSKMKKHGIVDSPQESARGGPVGRAVTDGQSRRRTWAKVRRWQERRCWARRSGRRLAICI